ncbi:DNA translocase FtsK [Desulfobulbus propionicus DSM 2032]|uniref:DNA translocase FtsK n=1 Tax=Desulfobulbus propionicus (strain ATCC 33891 / DSM 2032 / VKM B-1956 / 1pr3) TaxID=577650 RepID=A0A7U4DNE1_DESPD|nr:DNA translocase FtsK [Desulfobulbus propionicus]ADW16944.1 DNA translocase FtsK [Desulfobulbus propionicus DSM 2032]
MTSSDSRTKPRSRQEVVALLLLFLALFFLLALGSYIVPLLGAEPVLQQPSANWCGSLGFYAAHYLLSFLGLIAVLPLGLLGYAMVTVLLSRPTSNRLPAIVAGLSGIMISSSGLFGAFERLLLPPEFVAPGGYLGTLVWGLLRGVIGAAGSVLVLILLLIFSLMASVRFSPFAVITKKTDDDPPVEQLPLGPVIPPEGGRCRGKAPAVPRSAEPEPQPPTVASTAPPVHQPGKKTTAEPPDQDGGCKQGGQSSPFDLPPLSLLDSNQEGEVELSREHYYEVSATLLAKLQDFGVQGTVAGISPGPVVTTYEFSPAPGVKINKIVNLADDLAMVLKVDRVRIVGSIPGKAAIGIEIPNPIRRTVYLRDILLSAEYQDASSMLSLALGFDVIGRPVVANLARMPHLLIAGATGAGKSVAINAFIASILFKATPDDVRLLMIDPKRIELSVYDDIPHLLHPVVVEAKMASRALLWAVREMERRYRLLEERRVKSFASYNAVSEEKLPYIVIIVDELADLMMVASKDVETSIARLAQMARAAGMHIILATQRPSVDVLTGLIKANFPTRISFKVSSKVDSRTILDGSGAEHLLGMGDMLFLPPGAAKLQRIHGAFISEHETERLVSHLKEQGAAEYDESVLQLVEEEQEGGEGEIEEYDEKYDEAVAVVTETGQASISMVQRRLRVGYNRAARMIEIMEKEGIVGPADGSRPREVLVRSGYDDTE